MNCLSKCFLILTFKSILHATLGRSQVNFSFLDSLNLVVKALLLYRAWAQRWCSRREELEGGQKNPWRHPYVMGFGSHSPPAWRVPLPGLQIISHVKLTSNEKPHWLKALHLRSELLFINVNTDLVAWYAEIPLSVVYQAAGVLLHRQHDFSSFFL